MIKQMVRQKKEVDGWNYAKLSDIKQLLDDLICKYSGEAELQLDSYGNDVDWYIVWEREETDEEMKARILREERYKHVQYQQYLALKKQFEGDAS